LKLAGLAVVSAMALAAGDAPRGRPPNSPDLTIRTRVTHAGTPAQWEDTVRLKGARQAREHATAVGPRGERRAGFARIIQCDRQRALVLNHETRTYAYLPIADPAPGLLHLATAVAFGRRVDPHAPVTLRIIVDAVDTGERRQFGPLTARRVITTTTTEMPQARPSRLATRVQDGWYVDIPSPSCREAADEGVYFAIGSRAGEPEGRTEVVHRGSGRRGLPLVETDRTETPDAPAFRSSTELLEISERPLEASVFDVPPGYRPALRLWSGGYDFMRPDTPANRALLLWEGARDFVSALWR
jgi:hypothetical protein